MTPLPVCMILSRPKTRFHLMGFIETLFVIIFFADSFSESFPQDTTILTAMIGFYLMGYI